MARSVHKWAFPARFRAGSYSWKASRLACQRLREAVSEIKKVAKKNPLIGAEGVVHGAVQAQGKQCALSLPGSAESGTQPLSFQPGLTQIIP
jgi:hypothetical protein